jgi:hypothetical protein
MQNFMKLPLAAISAALTLTACPDEPRRPIGSSCGDDAACESGLCYADTCIDPLGDEDLDTLLNGVEASLGANPFAMDSDGDGVQDATEHGPERTPRDSDGDGKPDLVESSRADVDGDCITDQFDPDDSSFDPDGCGNVGDVTDGDTTLADTTVPDVDVPPTDSVANDTGTDDTSTVDTFADTTEPVPDTTTAPDITVPTASCTPSTQLGASSTRLDFSFPLVVTGASDTVWCLFQKFSRNHYAMAFDGQTWTEPATFLTSYDINPSSRIDVCQARGRITACRAETVDGGGNGVLAIHRIGGNGWLPPVEVPGVGAQVASHAVLGSSRVAIVTATNYNRDVDIRTWTPEGGLGAASALWRFPTSQLFETALKLDVDGNGAVISYADAGQRFYGQPIADALRGGEPVELLPTGTDAFQSGFASVLMPSGAVAIAISENARRIVVTRFAAIDGVGRFSPLEVASNGWAAQPSIAVATDEAVFVGWAGDGRSWLRRRAIDGTWGPIRDIGPTTGYPVQVLFDEGGAAWTAWIDPDDDAIHILRAAPGTDDFVEVKRIGRPEGVFSHSRVSGFVGPDSRVSWLWNSVDAGGTGLAWSQCQ